MDADRRRKLELLVHKLGLQVRDLELLDLALTHPTYAFEHNLPAHNQRLEFLGDAVLGLAVAEYLFQEFPSLPEGDLTRLRAALVCEASLARTAEVLGLGEFLLLGHGEEQGGGRHRPSNLADALEAVIGSLYLSVGLPEVKRLVRRLFGERIKELDGRRVVDFKTRLQEWVQKRGTENVNYKILDQWGPDHAKQFRAGVFYRTKLLATGEGRSKKEAEQEAARAALSRLQAGEEISLLLADYHDPRKDL
ncbi:ribonuclease III [Thermanaeromonas sp. C210]|uniref:ribonuclease III n=1 Tax=Thermanaeromonas sp. C210 TaxID=2731925 RepID=UPI00155CB75A|nr:ribonuclease III [Thermanaeromonas sp. C210]GFN23968.1 ribonuclease 3 [Thermanaeromonas sp. C210]